MKLCTYLIGFNIENSQILEYPRNNEIGRKDKKDKIGLNLMKKFLIFFNFNEYLQSLTSIRRR